MITKDGGNKFSGALFAAGTGSGLQSNNLTSELQSQGLTSVNSVRRVYDFNGALGGPLLKDRVWFFGSARGWGTTTGVANLYADANMSARTIGSSAASWRYAPDLNNPIYPAEVDRGGGIRFTVKPSQRDKFTVSYRPAAELPGSADGPARDRHDQERGEPGILSDSVGPAGHLDPPAIVETPARRGRHRQPVQLRRIRRRSLPERLRSLRRWRGQQRLDQRHQPRLHVQRHRQPEHGPVASDQRSVQPLLRDRRPQRQDRPVLDVRAEERA